MAPTVSHLRELETVSDPATIKDWIKASLRRSALQPIAHLALIVLDDAARAKANRAACTALAHRVAEVVIAVQAETQRSPSSQETTTFVDPRLTSFVQLLQDVQAFMLQQAESKWLKKLLRNRGIQEEIQQFEARLDDMCRIFQLSTLVGIRQLLSELHHVHTNINNEGRVGTDSPGSSNTIAFQDDQIAPLPLAPIVEGDFRVFLRHEVLLRRHLARRAHGGDLYEAEFEGKVVVVKTFGNQNSVAAKRFLFELRIWSRLWHPNLLQLIGYSKDRQNSPFMVMTGSRTGSTYMFVGTHLLSNPVQSHIVGMRILRDIVAAVVHIEDNQVLTQLSVDFLELSNIFMDNLGHAVIGDLPFEDHRVPADRDKVHTSLMHQYRRICRQILYGKDVFLHLWPALRLECPGTHINASYMGIILSFVMFLLNDGPTAALANFDTMLNAVSVYDRPTLSPQENMAFHMTILGQGFNPCKFSESFETEEDKQDKFQIGDIGYLTGDVDNPSWTWLCNVHTELGPVDDGSINKQGVDQNISGEGRKGWRNLCCFETSMAWRFLLRNVCSIARRFGVFPDQLILKRPLSRFVLQGEYPEVLVELSLPETRMDGHDFAHFAGYIRQQSQQEHSFPVGRQTVENTAKTARKARSLRQRLEWVHLQIQQCLEFEDTDKKEEGIAVGDRIVPVH